MTPKALEAALRALARPLPPADDPAVLHALERQADATPDDLEVRQALIMAHARHTADAGLTPVVADVRRDALIRWSAHDTTWLGVHQATGRLAMVRVLRPHAARDPLLRRLLVRDARVLDPVVAGLTLDGDAHALRAVLPGPPVMPDTHPTDVSASAVARLALGSLHAFVAWENAGIGIHGLVHEELADAGDHLAIVSLTPRPFQHAAHAVRRLATLLQPWSETRPDDPMAAILSAWTVHPPDSIHDAAQQAMSALAEHLADARHTVMRRAASHKLDGRRETLDDLAYRLEAAVPPPAGLAALGVDLDGTQLIVRGDGETITWGPETEAPVLFDLEDGFDVPLARRLVRARGAGGVSVMANAAIGGDPAYADQVTRWVAAALDLRTTRLLLDATA